MLSSKQPLSRHPTFLVALEAFLIVLGVALAYASTAWYETRKERSAASEALTSIIQEIRENRSAVLSSVQYHTEVQAELRASFQRGSPPARSSFPRGYIGPAEILTTAWELANSRGATATLPYDQVLEVSRLYADQEVYAWNAREVGSLIYGSIFAEGSASILDRYPNLLEIVMTFLYRECHLLSHQDGVLASLGANGVAGADTGDVCTQILGR